MSPLLLWGGRQGFLEVLLLFPGQHEFVVDVYLEIIRRVLLCPLHNLDIDERLLMRARLIAVKLRVFAELLKAHVAV